MSNHASNNLSGGISTASLPERWAARWDQTRDWLGLGMLFVPVGEALLRHYSEAGRFYHDGGHVLACLKTLDKYPGNVRDQDAMELALWYHDAVYDPKAKSGENEAQSVELFRREFGSVARHLVNMKEVERLILATRHQTEPDDADDALIMDIDLGILGADPIRYDAYAENIRKEYPHVDEEKYRAGRALVLRGFLARQSIYWTHHFRKTLEKQARKNLERELESLGGAMS